jgi:hypothetical protein
VYIPEIDKIPENCHLTIYIFAREKKGEGQIQPIWLMVVRMHRGGGIVRT